MIRFARPARPDTFKPRVPRGRRGPFDPAVWGDHKAAFSHAQHQKCAYCESSVAASQDGDVEHFAPKSAVRDVDPSAMGEEREDGLSRLRRGSRKTVLRSATGYWWRAHDWDNFVFACNTCNRKYKGTVFPLEPTPPHRWKPSSHDAAYQPLLLNCFDDEAPWRHFDVEPITGAMTGRTARGASTISTCGLHRQTLRKDRRHAASDAERWCRLIASTGLPVAWCALREIGGDDRPFAGAVRAVAEKALGLRWEDIVAYAATL